MYDDLYCPNHVFTLDGNPLDRVEEYKYLGSYIVYIVCNRIYPLELQIVQTNVKNSSSTFLDLDVSVNNGVFSSKLYDKRRDFYFKVVSFPHLKANIPQSPAYGIFIGEVYRICKSSSTDLAFINDVKLLICKLCNQSFISEILYRKLSSF